ncbi:helix-turn-helix domain-containing protein [Paenibacillus sp. HJL G12]|uniref:Helix-turn-helix domain-containing protein n=1 Tax=Paenibacillus dendrobii TaxID=2691084 RepID=A0A7X3INJ5_9BACL|nr:winged helix-turn-helix transcriptional regulator [Paenibacillus dendrobii]MWV47232.1 helix-turn-helix domain-containing protein [Paenibacillus dendrobii]
MLELSMERPEELVKVTHALSTGLRLKMMELLNTRRMNVAELAEALGIPVSTAASNVKVLEQAKLIETELLPASRGAMKVCSRMYDDIKINMNVPNRKGSDPNECYEIEIPIGSFTACEVAPTCGMVSEEGPIIVEDSPSGFFHPNRFRAQLVWLRKGYLEYRYPLEIPQGAQIRMIEFSMEICSEAPNYDNDWPSDITLWINGIEIGTWTSPGDFGGRRGKLNPAWWSDSGTQFGSLKTWSVDDQRSTLDQNETSSVTLDQLDLTGRSYVDMRIGVKEEAEFKGGMNLFGKRFGDYEQDLIMKIHYTSG